MDLVPFFDSYGEAGTALLGEAGHAFPQIELAVARGITAQCAEALGLMDFETAAAGGGIRCVRDASAPARMRPRGASRADAGGPCARRPRAQKNKKIERSLFAAFSF